MRPTTYINLPVDALVRLLTIATGGMVQASESKKSDAIIEFLVKKKQVQLQLDTLEERRAMDDEEERSRKAENYES